MNFRSTLLAFGLLLGMLWLFGLMLALHTGTLEKDLLLPTLHAASDAEIDQIVVDQRDTGAEQSIQFTRKDNNWRMRLPPVTRTAAAETSLVEGIISNLRGARQSREAKVSNDLSYYGLDKPSITVTLRGKEKEGGPTREWRVFIGKKSPDKDGFVYANSSDRPGEVLAVPQSSLRQLFISDPASLRVHTLLDTTDNSLQWVSISGDKNKLELQRAEGTTWRYLTPKLGYAEWQGPEGKKLGPVELAPDGVRGLATALGALRVEQDGDFVPLNDDELGKYGLGDGHELYRIAISNDPKEKNQQTLLIGSEPKNKPGRYYARLADEQAPVIIDGKRLEPILRALKAPESLRSHALVHSDLKKIDALEIRTGKDLKEVVELRQENDKWKIDYLGTERGTYEPAVKDLLTALEGERQIRDFVDATGDVDKQDAELGLAQPVVEIKVWLSAVRENEKVKKETKRTPAVTITFGQTKGEVVYGKSETNDGLVSRFTVAKSLLDRLTPPTGVLAFLERSLPDFAPDNTRALTVTDGGRKVEVARDTKGRWQMLGGSAAGSADTKKVEDLLHLLKELPAKEWVRKADAQTDLKEFGLNDPTLAVTLYMKEASPKPAALASAASLAAVGRPLEALAAQLAAQTSSVTWKFGKSLDDKNETYALRSDNDIVFRVANESVQSLREFDLRDRFWLTHLEPLLDATLTGLLAAPPTRWLGATPLFTHQAAAIDPAAVKELRVTVRTPAELRRFAFARKDKSWQEKTGLEEFAVDGKQVDSLVDRLAGLRTGRFVRLQGGPLPEMKLASKEAALRLELVGDSGTLLDLTLGAATEAAGYYAQIAAWPEAVFTVPRSDFEPLLNGASYFSKTRVAAK